MTIFGFNTNVQQGDVAYHVQTEARPHDLVLQTLIFVKGQCVGKHTYSYAAKTLEPGFSDQAMHELLKAQHKALIDSVHQGRMEEVLGGGGEVYDVGGSTLFLKWTNPGPGSSGGATAMTLHIERSGQPVASAEVEVFPCLPAPAVVLARGLTGPSGDATLTFQPTREVEQEAAVIVRATHGGESATRKFRFKK